jgi:CDP-diacylglycerol--glycerol-3-phosphate 3-phosphatidyltransferase
MISIYNIKPKFQKVLRPLLDSLYKFGITANQITLSSVFLSFIIGMLFWFADINRFFYLALPVGLIIRMALNALDGMMARIYNQQSKKGEVLNEIGDVVSDFFVFFPLLKFELEILYLIICCIFFSIINEFAGILGKVVSGERRYEGPMGKSDRAFLLGIYGVLGFFSIKLSGYSVLIFSSILILLMVSTYFRIKKSLQNG